MCFCILIVFWVSNFASSRCKVFWVSKISPKINQSIDVFCILIVFLGVKHCTIFGCQRLIKDWVGRGDID